MAGINSYTGALGNITQASTYPVSTTLEDANGDPIDVTGYKLYLGLSTSRDGSTEATEFVFDPTDAANGILSGELTDSETLALDAGIWYYSLKYITSDGKAFTIDMGRIKVIDAINERVAQ